MSQVHRAMHPLQDGIRLRPSMSWGSGGLLVPGPEADEQRHA